MDLRVKVLILGVMGLIDLVNKNKQPEADPNKLTSQELEYLLTTLKSSTLRGDQVEQFYNLVIKLQNQYLALTQK